MIFANTAVTIKRNSSSQKYNDTIDCNKGNYEQLTATQ